jgi:hypothetical protein
MQKLLNLENIVTERAVGRRQANSVDLEHNVWNSEGATGQLFTEVLFYCA